MDALLRCRSVDDELVQIQIAYRNIHIPIARHSPRTKTRIGSDAPRRYPCAGEARLE